MRDGWRSRARQRQLLANLYQRDLATPGVSDRDVPPLDRRWNLYGNLPGDLFGLNPGVLIVRAFKAGRVGQPMAIDDSEKITRHRALLLLHSINAHVSSGFPCIGTIGERVTFGFGKGQEKPAHAAGPAS
jgi:hypothetical protein